MLTAKRGFSIEELSRRTGVHVETIRYYERIGLLPPPPRSGGGHRLYSDNHLKRLTFIRRKIADLRRMERTLAETAARCDGGGAPECPIVDVLFSGSRSSRRAA